MPRKPAPQTVSETDLLEHALVEGTKKFGKPKREDRFTYGRLHAKDDLLAFARYVDEEFETPPHIKQLADAFTRIEQGKLKRLIINIPPGHGKSNLAKLFVAWALGRNPKRRIIYSSYSDDKASEVTGAIRDIIESNITKDIFPDLDVRADVRAKELWQTTKKGIVTGAGAGGAITGRRMDIGIIDDPYKNYEEATSEKMPQKIWDWYRTTFRTRLARAGAIIVIHTRWMQDDLTGRLIEREGDTDHGGKWEKITLPALSNENLALWPEMYPVEELYELKDLLDHLFEAIYQQEPADVTGRLFSQPPIYGEPETEQELIGGFDPAFGGSDSCALALGFIDRKNDDPKTDTIYIVAAYHWQLYLPETYDKLETLCRLHKVKKIWIEDNGAQEAVVVEMKRRGLNAEGTTSSNQKFIRIQNYVKMHWAKLRFSRKVENKFMKEVLAYSELAKHDDAPDALACLIRYLNVGRTPLSKRYSMVSRLLGNFGRR